MKTEQTRTVQWRLHQQHTGLVGQSVQKFYFPWEWSVKAIGEWLKERGITWKDGVLTVKVGGGMRVFEVEDWYWDGRGSN